MPSLKIEYSGEVEEILRLLGVTNIQNGEIRDDNSSEYPNPIEVLEALRETFLNFASELEHREGDERLVSHLRFGADFVAKVIELRHIKDEDEYSRQLFNWVLEYYSEIKKLPY